MSGRTLTRAELDALPLGARVGFIDGRGCPGAAVKVGTRPSSGAETFSITGPTLVGSFAVARAGAVLLEPAEPGPAAPEVQVAEASLDQPGSRQVTGYPDTPRGRQDMPTSPALHRGAEALDAALSLTDDGHGSSMVLAVALDVVSAALHDPDDDVIARALVEHPRISGIHGDCLCGHVVPLGGSFAAHQADAVRAAILGARGDQAENREQP